ncbi:Protein of unknown functionlike protein -like protein [Hapsidospora chrysogenum ATCC 11550]|uniref:Scaffold protein Nfu/NifU N-terminal domain-containing protein n=1 Tax=Hapsidospora chrysogenum (strain ATCC 11550 / CBS 779.69 / DSM 880 / IAM 14645 / JCM 23072 / IMI 49137) TaxID=857340 RepID=A0A086TBH7_HAPC1|nr:Protein of unknown functionlike protein -like protein [Hapsidospora chrysogenum ATCC 11550]
MASMKTSRAASRLLATASRPALECHYQARVAPRWLGTLAAATTARARVSPTASGERPLARRSNQQRFALPGTGPVAGVRTIFIQTESTPNADALKFLPGARILPESINTPFIEYLNPRSTISPPYPSQLASKLMNIDGITSVFYGTDFITVTKAADANWAHVRPEIFALITEAVTSGETIVNVAENKEGEPAEEDSLAYNEDDSEVVGMIKELLETRIRPAIQEDGGDIEFRGFENGLVSLKLRGACRTCDSSTVTLKNGIESMLMHYIEEVQGVHQVLDEEEEIALKEFEKFEEKLKQQKGAAPA